MKKILYFLMLILVSFLMTGCQNSLQSHKIYLEDAFSIVPYVDIRAKNEFLTIDKKEQIKNDLDDIVVRLDRIFNVQLRGDGIETELMKVNKNAGIKPVEVSFEVIEVLKVAIQASELSICEACNNKPLFDPTIAPVWDLWGFANNYYEPMDHNLTDPPQKELIINRLPLVDYSKINIDEENQTVFLAEPNMKIDLGGIVKGYAADKVKEYLVSAGIEKAIIDIGGNIHTIGTGYDKKGKDRPWLLGIQTPYYKPGFNNLPQYFGIYSIDDQTLVTSGVYERYIMDESFNEYHHILSPITGYPIDNGVMSTSIITDNSTWADALSTTIFALGLKEGMKKVEELPNVEAVFVVKNGSYYDVYISSGAEQYFQYIDKADAHNYRFKGVYKGE